MITFYQTYESYLKVYKKFRIDGIEERVRGYGWHCDGNELKGHYVTTDNYKLFYDMQGGFVRKEAISHLVTI